jgi:hypothetical protein
MAVTVRKPQAVSDVEQGAVEGDESAGKTECSEEVGRRDDTVPFSFEP